MKKNKPTHRFRSIILFPIILIGLGTSLGCATSGPAPQTMGDYTDFSGAAGKGAYQYQTAHQHENIDTFKSLPEMTSEDFEGSGDMHLRNGEFYMALIQYEKALSLKPKNIRIHYKKV